MEAIEARQRRTWAQFVWRRREEPDTQRPQLAGDWPALEHTTAALPPAEESTENVAVQKQALYSIFGVEPAMEFVESAYDFWESVQEGMHRWLDTSE